MRRGSSGTEKNNGAIFNMNFADTHLAHNIFIDSMDVRAIFTAKNHRSHFLPHASYQFLE